MPFLTERPTATAARMGSVIYSQKRDFAWEFLISLLIKIETKAHLTRKVEEMTIRCQVAGVASTLPTLLPSPNDCPYGS